MTAVMLLMMSVVAGVVSAATPVLLPTDEAAETWVNALTMAGLRIGPPGDGPWVIIANTPATWVLVVRGRDGTVRRSELAPPTTPQQREELAFVAASLVRAATPVVVQPAAPVDPTPPKPKPKPKPDPAPVAPEVTPDPEPVVVLPPEPAPSQWSIAGGLMGGVQRGGGADASAALGLAVETRRQDGVLVGIGITTVPSATAAGLPNNNRVRRGDIDIYAGLQHRTGLRMSAGAGASWRRFYSDDSANVDAWFPTLRTAAGWALRMSEHSEAVPQLWLSADLRELQTANGSPPYNRAPTWSLGLGLRVAGIMPARTPKGPSTAAQGRS